MERNEKEERKRKKEESESTHSYIFLPCFSYVIVPFPSHPLAGRQQILVAYGGDINDTVESKINGKGGCISNMT